VRIKLDENLPPAIGDLMAGSGFDVATVAGEGLGGCEDEVLYDACRAEQRILVTLDTDFANPLRFPPEGTAGIVVLRPPRPLLALLRSSLANVLARITVGGEKIADRLWIVEATSIRIYEPPER